MGSAADERIDNEGAIADTAFLKRPAFATISASAAKPNCSNGWERLRVGSAADERTDNEGAIADTAFSLPDCHVDGVAGGDIVSRRYVLMLLMSMSTCRSSFLTIALS